MPFLRRRPFPPEPASCGRCSRGHRYGITVEACAGVRPCLILRRLHRLSGQREALFPTTIWCTSLLLVHLTRIQQSRGGLIADLLSEHHHTLCVILALWGLRLVRRPNFDIINLELALLWILLSVLRLLRPQSS